MTHTGQRRNAVIVFLRKTAEKNPLGRPEHRWDNNIININDVLWERMWNGLIWLS